MAGESGNSFCTAPWAEKIWFTCGQEFGAQFGAIFVLKRALYGLKIASDSFHNFFGKFLRCIGFTSSREDQDLWMRKSNGYDGYDYIDSRIDAIIIAEKNPYKYMNEF